MLVNSIPQGWVEVVRTERRAAKERICWSRHGNDDRTELKSSSFGRENKDAIVQCRANVELLPLHSLVALKLRETRLKNIAARLTDSLVITKRTIPVHVPLNAINVPQPYKHHQISFLGIYSAAQLQLCIRMTLLLLFRQSVCHWNPALAHFEQ